MEIFLIIAIVIAIVSVISAVLAYLAYRKKNTENTEQKIEIAKLETAIVKEREAHEREIKALKDSEQRLTKEFENLGNKIFDDKSEKFEKITLKPFKEQISKFESVLKTKGEEHIELKTQLENVLKAGEKVSKQAYDLEQALKNRSDVRGRWGEMTLKRIAELAGMVEHCDFDTQVHSTDNGEIQRPDMIVHLPERGVIVVDAKTNLNAYLESLSSNDEQQAKDLLKKHAQNIKDEVSKLSKKAYWEAQKDSPEFVVLFVPGDHFLSVALQHDPDLQEKAMENKVVLATPNTLFALLRAIAFGWQQKKASENSEQIREAGEELYKRFETFYSHFESIGKSIGSVTKHYNSAVGSFEQKVRPQGRRFEKLGINRELKEGTEITETTRTPSLTSGAQEEGEIEQ
ncbi:DNA recombination protein RmuC [Candidatus Mycalebacterium sp.]